MRSHILLAALLASGTAILAQETPSADPIFDDREIEAKLVQALEAIQEAKPEDTLDAYLKAGADASFQYTLAPPAEVRLEPTAVHERMARATLVLGLRYKCSHCTRWHVGPSSAFLIASEGVIATSYHVVEKGGGALAAMDVAGRTWPVQGVVALDQASDLALLRIAPPADLVPLPIATELPRAGEDVFVLSHPAAHFFVYTRGIASRLSRGRQDRFEALEITAPYARGSSGAPVVDARGNVVGVVKATRSIYYEEHAGGESENLQMVIQMTVPASKLRTLALR